MNYTTNTNPTLNISHSSHAPNSSDLLSPSDLAALPSSVLSSSDLPSSNHDNTLSSNTDSFSQNIDEIRTPHLSSPNADNILTPDLRSPNADDILTPKSGGLLSPDSTTPDMKKVPLNHIELSHDKHDDHQVDPHSDIDSDVDRHVTNMAFGSRGSWFVRWSDGSLAWDQIPPSLHNKLFKRHKFLPTVKSLSISSNNDWLIVFDDGSFATSGFPMYGRLKESLADESDPVNFVFAPAGGWLLIRENGSMAWERLPTSLDELLKRRTQLDPAIEQISISGFGGWFVRFADGECEWEAIPKPLQKLLISRIRHADPNILVTLSPADGLSYFVAIGEVGEFVHDNPTLRTTLEFANGIVNQLPESVTWDIPKTPPPTPMHHDPVGMQEFSLLKKISDMDITSTEPPVPTNATIQSNNTILIGSDDKEIQMDAETVQKQDKEQDKNETKSTDETILTIDWILIQ
ncbi:hypothetical protein BC833DRAFT_596323 [Globomyces pollinis-pini]|nr:hypothetical protein BC833DRAFT_596323 [Globomyces pollinis-pini]